MKLTVIIPVYNEIEYIDILLKKVLATSVDKQIIVVDDFSEDGTREKLTPINATGNMIPFSPNIKLFDIADKYWTIEICPNRKCRFDIPIIIFS